MKYRIWFIVWTALATLAWKKSVALPHWDISFEGLAWGILFGIALNGALTMYLVIKNE